MDLKQHPVPTCYYGQGHFSLDQVAQGPSQPSFEPFLKVGASTASLGNNLSWQPFLLCIPLKALAAEIEKNQAKLDQCQKFSQQYSAAVKVQILPLH